MIFGLDGTAIWLGAMSLAGLLGTGVLVPLALNNRKRVSRAETKATTAAQGAVWTAAVLDKKIEDKIGTPNGKGNVIQMLEMMHSQLETMNARLGLVDERSDATCQLLTEHLKRYDRDHPPFRTPPAVSGGG